MRAYNVSKQKTCQAIEALVCKGKHVLMESVLNGVKGKYSE